MPRLEFFYDYGSPFSYLVDTRLPALCRETGAELVHRPVLIGGIFKATGNRSPLQETVENKRNYGGLTLQRWVEHYGAPFTMNPHFPINTLLLMRAALAAQKEGVFDRYHPAIFSAFWAEGEDLGNPEIVARVLERAGVDAVPLLEAAGSPEIKEALKVHTEEAVSRGAFGVPTFFVGEQMFFGNDHMAFLERALGKT